MYGNIRKAVGEGDVKIVHPPPLTQHALRRLLTRKRYITVEWKFRAHGGND